MHETYDSAFPAASMKGRFPRKLGIIGGGQLARMTAMAALPLGVEVCVLEPSRHSPATRVSPDCLAGDWKNPSTLREFASRCDLVTLENEFVDAGALRPLEEAGCRVLPAAACVAVTQDKLTQKSALQAGGVAVPDFCAVGSPDEVLAAGGRWGWPLLLKLRRDGYDGKGNHLVRSPDEVSAAWQALDGANRPLLAEAFFPFVKELAVIVTRALDGQTAVYPVVETIQQNHVCRVVMAPADIAPELADRAAALARRAVEIVGGTGSFGVELFLTDSGGLAVNELAPRVHNSGHYTIEACVCSQFENHVRAVMGWPLGDPSMIVPAAVMVNLLGDATSPGEPHGVEETLAMPGAHLHLYGKLMSGPGRKMGHVTALADTLAKASRLATAAAGKIRFS